MQQFVSFGMNVRGIAFVTLYVWCVICWDHDLPQLMLLFVNMPSKSPKLCALWDLLVMYIYEC